MTTAEATPISVKISPLFCYGVKPNVFGGIHFTRENYLLYVNGCGISLYHHGDKKQELVPLADKGKHLTAIGTYWFFHHHLLDEIKFANCSIHLEKEETFLVYF